MTAGTEYDPSTDVGKVRLKIGDKALPFLLTDAEVNVFLTEANTCHNGAAGLALLALAATKADAWATVNAGQISRSKADPRAAMQALAEQYIGMSDEVMLDASKDVAFGVARVDWMPEVSADAEKLRDLAEDLEG